jgi:pyruvate carboxylase
VQLEKASGEPGSIGAPMPGVVINIKAEIGQKVYIFLNSTHSKVSVGTPLCILSAMKMETVVAAPIEGIVKRLAIKVGDNLKAGDLLVEISAN